MSFTDVWNEAYPAGTTYANELDTAITQGGKRAWRERLAVDHDVRSSESGAEEGDDGDIVELFYEDDTGTSEVQLTLKGELNYNDSLLMLLAGAQTVTGVK